MKNVKNNNQNTKKNSKKQLNKKNGKKVQKKKNIKLRKAILIIIIMLILIIIFTLILFSDLFSIKQITVVNNSKISSEEIIEKSDLMVGSNMFKKLKVKSKANIKKEPYIENVKIKKKLNGEVIIEVEERVPTYMLVKEVGYAYINNQGYILENSEIPLQLPIIIGYESSNIEPGERLISKDLEKLDTVNEIFRTANSNGIAEKIYSIDISNKGNYILQIPTEDKDVEFGDKTNINVKILWIVDLIEKTKGIPGTIVLNVTNIKKVYFRERV